MTVVFKMKKYSPFGYIQANFRFIEELGIKSPTASDNVSKRGETIGF